MKRGFTLVELLVVVLIIGILSAIAIPMYQGTVDKSHWSTMLPGAKALKDAEEAVRMSNGLYTANMDNLDVRMPNGDVQYTLETVNDDGTANVVRGTSTKLPTVRLSNYLDENVNFAGQLHCEVANGDERATRLCEKLLQGQFLQTSGGYTAYLLDQEIDKDTCDGVEQSWSTSKTKCYRDHQSRCDALNADYLGNGQCGWAGTNGTDIGEEKVCIGSNSAHSNNCYKNSVGRGGKCIAGSGSTSACGEVEINNGGICDAKGGWYGCGGVTIKTGGVCLGKTNNSCLGVKGQGGICVALNYGGCRSGDFKNGSICYAVLGDCGQNGGSAAPSYDGKSCCCGNCHSSARKCADIGVACDPYYMDPNNFKDL